MLFCTTRWYLTEWTDNLGNLDYSSPYLPVLSRTNPSWMPSILGLSMKLTLKISPMLTLSLTFRYSTIKPWACAQRPPPIEISKWMKFSSKFRNRSPFFCDRAWNLFRLIIATWMLTRNSYTIWSARFLWTVFTFPFRLGSVKQAAWNSL